MMRLFFLFLLFALLPSCGSLENDPALDAEQTIVIHDYSFIPDGISVSAGAAVLFYNMDPEPHQILSASDNNLFDASGVLDSSVILPEQFGVVVVPETARPGERIFFYDGVFKETMTTPNGVIVIE